MTKTVDQNINLKTVGLLVSTTDMRTAKRLRRRVSISSLLNGECGHYRVCGRSVFIYAFGEMHELELS